MKYFTKARFIRLVKFCFSALILYILKAPIQVLLTDFIHIHYLISGAVAGAVITLAQFLPVEHWIWKGGKK